MGMDPVGDGKTGTTVIYFLKSGSESGSKSNGWVAKNRRQGDIHISDSGLNYLVISNEGKLKKNVYEYIYIDTFKLF